MEGYLNEIQHTALIYAEILSKILKTNVTIVDENLRRIAIPSYMHSYYKEAMEKKDITLAGGIIAHTIQKRKVNIVDTPKEHEACHECPNKNRCIEKYHMSAPILVRGEARGALAFIATNNQQRKRMEKQRQLYLDLLIQFSDLIALKIDETHEKRANLLNLELLQEIVEHSNDGVLVFDNEGALVQMNTISSNLLEIQEPLPIRVTFTLLLEEENASVYLLKRKHQTYKLLGKRYHLSMERYSDIFIFSNGIRTTSGQEKKKHCEDGVARLFGKSLSIERTKTQIINLSNGKAPILVKGDTGTEKRETALAIHEESSRREKEVYSVNCKIYTADALEVELMGIASANSRRGKASRIELLREGTIILEEIDKMPLFLQAKILRILEENIIFRKGGQKPISVDVRIIATTAKDLAQLVDQGQFMEELYFKLIPNAIVLPALTARKEDIPIYARYYLEKYARQYGKAIVKIEEEFFANLERYPWTGNVWELKGVMEHVITVMRLDGIVDIHTLPEYLTKYKEVEKEKHSFNLKILERNTIKQALKEIGCDSKCRQNVADELGIGIATLYRKMKEYNLF